ncbi:MAG: chemotaxis protein CheD [Gammaproteobacteria bacterium]|nr:chemotaxis protein CheD [Gammaproteobacteria bacterium]MBU1488895.1 chemotaxis protein CheD [Gammaproteobacteria bacterium]MBU2067450.1 chemotaxis protein CheD [Gammaproteobacteria bacterium]MBU2138885.1 chemotaxis protein CheD [Gammaproteobacteria bacterium]MBU2216708.1 chemotaxis protein CheD [Gammaproteobacteria bacterium]
MTNTPSIAEVYLRPGDYHFGGPYTRIRTLLGSCVSLVVWHPRARLGGMCHFMLPTRGRPTTQLDGRYGDEAMRLLRDAANSNGTCFSEYQVRIFGGGNMFPTRLPSNSPHIGLQNVAMARRLVAEQGLICHGEHVGGIGHRNLIFDIWSGHLALKQSPPLSISGPSGVSSV